MSAPVFQNDGGINGALGGTTATASLPGSRSNGDLLLAECQVLTGLKTIVETSDWHIEDDATDANTSTCWAWRYVDGTEAAPNFSWTGSAVWHCKVVRYNGVASALAIGAKSNGKGNSATLAIGAITTTQPDSTVVALLLDSGGGTIPTPSGYTSESAFADAFASDKWADQAFPSAGSSSGAISLSISSVPWSGFLFELRSVVSPAGQAAGVGAAVGVGASTASAHGVATATGSAAGDGAGSASATSSGPVAVLAMGL